jgi:hypothetical protein
METAQTSQTPQKQRPDGESRRLEYKSPTLRKLGNLTDVTLTIGTGTMNDGMANKSH